MPSLEIVEGSRQDLRKKGLPFDRLRAGPSTGSGRALRQACPEFAEGSVLSTVEGLRAGERKRKGACPELVAGPVPSLPRHDLRKEGLTPHHCGFVCHAAVFSSGEIWD